jgi:polysaccharide biosynthesis protein PslG
MKNTMTNKKIIALSIKTGFILMILIISGISYQMVVIPNSVPDGPRYQYVGAKKCASECHNNEKMGYQYNTWRVSPHSNAFIDLSSGRAKVYARKANIAGNLPESPACLKCHSSAGNLDSTYLTVTYRVEEGVTCEACHKHEYETKTYLPSEADCLKCHNSSMHKVRDFNFKSDCEKIAHSRPDSTKKIADIPEYPESDVQGKFGPVGKVCSGVNIHFTKGHEKDLDMIATAGFRFIRMDLIWEETENIKGTYDWTSYDELTANLNKRGLRAIYILDYSNSLYEDTVKFKDTLTGLEYKDIASPQHPESIAAFARWAEAAAIHFKDNKVIWEIWNEPNVSYWRPVADVKQYIALALAACKAVKSAVPNSVIIAPGTSQVPLPFLEPFLASDVLEYLDGVSVHPYRDYSLSPENASSDYRKVRDIIARHTPAGKKEIPVISSEWGYSSATNGLSVETQAEYIVRMQLSNLLNAIPLSIWYDWKNDGISPTDFEHNCGTVTYDLIPKPAYTAIQTMNKQLDSFSFVRRIDLKNDNDYALLFKNENGNYRITAWSTDQSHSVLIDNSLQNVKGATAIDGEGNVVNLKTDNGKLVLDLKKMPQYVSLPIQNF